MNLIHPSGGLWYHGLALKYKHSLWKPFQAFIERSLPMYSDWIVIGPSGGYNLPSSIQIQVAIDIDPLARFFFKSKTQWIRKDFFHEQKNLKVHTDFQLFLEKVPGPILFSNVLGQLFYLAQSQESESQVIRFTEELWTALRGRKVVSFHDRISCDLIPKNIEVSEHVDNETLIRKFYPNFKESDEFLDHWTSHLGQTTKKVSVFPWQITRKRSHLIEYCEW